MNKKEIVNALLVIGLSGLFIGICVAVFLTKGKSEKWVTRKMKIGGLLLTLTAIACNESGGGLDVPPATCYVVLAPNTMWVQTHGKSGIEIDLDTGNVITGGIYPVEGNQFSFAVTDANSNKLQTGEIGALDGTYDEDSEEFEIILNQNLAVGNYFLDLYATNIAGQNNSTPRRHINLTIKDE